MDAAQALSELRQISSQVEDAVVLDDKGTVVAPGGDGERLAGVGKRLLDEAARVKGAEPAQLEAATANGSVFVLREGGRTIIARTGPEPTVGLVFYDLKSCLRAIDAKPKRRRTTTATKSKTTTTRKKKENGAP